MTETDFPALIAEKDKALATSAGRERWYRERGLMADLAAQEAVTDRLLRERFMLMNGIECPS